MTTFLRDANGKIIGSLKEQGGKTRLYNKGGKLMGWYDPSSNTTADSNGSIVARCNILVSLLKN